MNRQLLRNNMIVITILILNMVVLSGCAYPPMGYENVTDPEKYMEVNWFVNKELNDYFEGSMPKEIPKQSNNVHYYYHYSAGILGDPSFLLDLSLVYNSDTLYSSENTRLGSLCHGNITTTNGCKYYLIQFKKEDLQNYMDDEIYDGLSYNFEIAAANDLQKSIEYLSAKQYDSAGVSDDIRKLLAPLL